MPELMIQYKKLKAVTFRFEDSRITIGRRADNDLRLPDRKVSEIHAQVYRKDNGYYLKDLCSANGTFHNRKLINAEVPLAAGDVIVMGDTELIFNWP